MPINTVKPMKKIYLLLLCVLFSLSTYSQWNTVTVGTGDDVYSVDYYSASEAWLGSVYKTIKTNDGGATWITNTDVEDVNGTTIGLVRFYDIIGIGRAHV